MIASTWLEVMGASAGSPVGVAVTVAALSNVPGRERSRVHVYVVSWPGASSASPGPTSVPASQFASVKPESASTTLPVFFTTISYSTVEPTGPSTVAVVKLAPLPMRWRFSTVKLGSRLSGFIALTETTT